MQKNKDKKDGRGGARPGAGRKPIGSRVGICISFRVPEEIRDEIRLFIQQRGIPCAMFLIEAVRLMKEHYGEGGEQDGAEEDLPIFLPSFCGRVVVGESEIERGAELADAVFAPDADGVPAGQG